MMKTLVLGIGNPILQDDGVGIHVINALRPYLTKFKVTVDIAYTGGMNLLDIIRGFDKVILIDAIKNDTCKIGEVKCFTLAEAPAVHSSNPHDLSLSEALYLAKQIGEKQLPKEIVVIGIAVKNTNDFGEHLTNKVAAAIPHAVSMVIAELQNT
jgi:hydrogenase maturation protease